MSFEALAVCHSYDYDPHERQLPGPFGLAVAAAAGDLYIEGKIDGVYFNGRSLFPSRSGLAEVALEPIKQEGIIPDSAIVIETKAASSYGEIRGYRNYLARNGNPSGRLIDLASHSHQQQAIRFLYGHFFSSEEEKKAKFFAFEEVLANSSIKKHRDLIDRLKRSSIYQGFEEYMQKHGGGYRSQLILAPILEISGPLVYLKYLIQIKSMGWPVPE